MSAFFRRRKGNGYKLKMTRSASYGRGARPPRGGAPFFASIAGALSALWLLLFGFIYNLKNFSRRGRLIAVALAALLVTGVTTAVIMINLNNDPSRQTPVNARNLESPAPSVPVTPYAPAYTPAPTPTPPPTPTPTPHPSNTVIERDMETPIVAEIQARLMELYYMEEDEPTEFFGRITENSVMLFQRQHELVMDGKVDLATFEMLMSGDAQKYTVMLGADGTDVKELQARLRELGYMDEVTGHFGEVTETAVKAFQKNNNLSADGKVGQRTREALYSTKSKPNMSKYSGKSDELKSLQNLLKKYGYLTTEPDGAYGSDTKAAVERFQQVNGLIDDGYLGYTTIRTLKGRNAQPNALKLGMEGTDVRNVQKRLKELGYMSAVTGYYGEKTQEAVKSFQKTNKLGVDGTVGKVTMNALTSSKAKRAPGGSSPGGGGSAGGDSSSGGSSSGVNKLISVATSKLGSRYVFAAKGPNTFDCSGFVYYCLNQAGVKVGYMTSGGWQTTGRFPRIRSMSDLKKGDILSFKGHVGIYIGGGQMIDASSGRGVVKKTSINISYWQRNFVCAYRVF